jgi:hypothetical protein
VANRLIHPAWLSVTAGLLAAGCTSSSFTPPPSDAQLRASPAPANFALLASPQALREDYVYPPGLSTQTLRWQGHEMEWRMRLAHRRYAYAGIVLRHPADFTAHKDATALFFRMKPASMAEYLSIGLVDGNAATNHVLLDLPLAAWTDARGDGWAKFRIPLNAFGNEGLPVAGPGEAPHAAGRAPFDWADFREIRFSTIGTIPREEVVITDLRFKR